MKFTGFPDIDIAAISRRVERPLAVWYSARALDRRGSGSVAVTDPFGSLGTAARGRDLRRGEGIFWTLAGARLFLRAPGLVAKAFEIPRLTTAYEAPAAWLRATGQRLRANMFLNAVSLLRKGRLPIAVRTMAELAGVNRRTILRWQALTGWEKIANRALLKRLDDKGGRFHVTGSRGPWLLIRMNDGVYLGRRLPNALAIRRPPAKKRKVLRRANALLQSCQKRDRGERQQIYLPPGQHLPSLPSQYHQIDKVKDSQLWVPGGRWVP